MLAALGAVAVETQCLVGQKFLSARVDSGSQGNTAIMESAKKNTLSLFESDIREKKSKDSNKCVMGPGG